MGGKHENTYKSTWIDSEIETERYHSTDIRHYHKPDFYILSHRTWW